MGHRLYARYLCQHQIRRYRSNAFITPTHGQAATGPVNVDPGLIGLKASTDAQGQLIAIKDNICTTEFPTTCASSILGDFQSPYDATVVELLRRAGAIITGKTNMDEFGMGSHSTHSRFGAVVNPQCGQTAKELSAGGSSGGSAVAVQDGQVYAALGTDTGGSVRLPAAYTGTVGFKPSYGLLSRYGVVAYANSLDTVGILGRTVAAVRSIFALLNRYDKRDPTSLSLHTRSRIATSMRNINWTDTQSQPSYQKGPLRRYRIGIPQEYNIEELDATVRQAWVDSLRILQSLGHTVHLISLPATRQALSAYYVLAPAEASSNLAKYDGVRYGRRVNAIDDEGGNLYASTRGMGFGEEVKRRILLGTYSLSAAAMDNYFIQAQKVRRLIQQDFDAVFLQENPLHRQSQHEHSTNKVDFILTPTAPTPPPTHASLRDAGSVDAYTNDVFTVPASLAGLPAVSVPVRAKVMAERSIGMQFVGQFGSDDEILDLAEEFRDAVES